VSVKPKQKFPTSVAQGGETLFLEQSADMVCNLAAIIRRLADGFPSLANTICKLANVIHNLATIVHNLANLVRSLVSAVCKLARIVRNFLNVIRSLANVVRSLANVVRKAENIVRKSVFGGETRKTTPKPPISVENRVLAGKSVPDNSPAIHGWVISDTRGRARRTGEVTELCSLSAG
jgi:prophage DNA circulation protein